MNRGLRVKIKNKIVEGENAIDTSREGNLIQSHFTDFTETGSSARE